tara:strand:- start:19775 stop:28831 length:9057 start_codon:yes stop_codon:yes gene_type:complete
MGKSIIKLLTVSTIITSFASFLFANNGSGQVDYTEIERQDKIAKGLIPFVSEAAELNPNQDIEIQTENHKPYQGFLGVKYSKEQGRALNGLAGDIIKALNNADGSSGPINVEKLEKALGQMSYEEIKGIYLYTNSPIVEGYMYSAWLEMDRTADVSFPRATTGETEPNNTASTAGALSDTVKAYLTAYDEDWFVFTTTAASDIVLETGAGAGTDNVGDTKMWLFNNPDSAYVDYDDDGGTSGYSKITYRSYAAGTYYVKVAGYTGTYAGAYVLAYANTAFSAQNGSVVINEIHYNPSSAQGSDSEYEFLELYNTTAADIDMGGWSLTRDGGLYSTDLSGTVISANSYAVIAYTGATYASLSVPVVNAGYFGLSNSGKDLVLLDSLGRMVDEVTYDDNYPSTNPWNHTDADGDDADGDGPSLELKDPSLDNSLASSWKASGVDNGTPGAANSMKSDILMVNTSVSTYQGIGSTETAALKVKNLGYADLTIDSVVASQYISATSYLSESFESGLSASGWTFSPSTGSGAWGLSNGSSSYPYYGPGTSSDGSYSVYFNVYSFSSGITGSMTTPAVDFTSAATPSLTFDFWNSTGSDPVYVAVSTDGGTTFTNLDTLSPGVTSWTSQSVDLSSYAGLSSVHVKITAVSDYGYSNPHIDNVSIAEPGYTTVPSWLTVTAPSAIAAGDSGEIGLSFSGASFTSDYDGSATLSIYNNDPRDTLKTATASISVRADTAILSYSSGTAWLIAPIGDTSGVVAITLSNPGGAALLVDSVRFSSGSSSSYITSLADSSVIEPNTSTSFTASFAPTAAGTDLDTMVFHANTDSSGNSSLKFSGYGYDSSTDTLYGFPSGSAAGDGWVLTDGGYPTTNGSGYIQAVDGTIISPKSIFTSASKMHFTFRNPNAATQDVSVYYSDDKSGSQWADWTAVETITLAAASTAGLSNTQRFVVDAPATADTGYVALKFSVPGALTHYSSLRDAVIGKSAEYTTVDDSDVSDQYVLEDFDGSFSLPSGWTGDFSVTSSGGAVDGGYYARGNVYSSDPRDTMSTHVVGPFESGDSLSFYFRAVDYYGGTGTSFSGDDAMSVYSQNADGSDRTLLWAATAATHTPTTDWAHVSVAVPNNLIGERGVFVFDGVRATGDWYASYDQIRYAERPIPIISVSPNSIDFGSMATGGQTRTATITVNNTGGDTLTGSISMGTQATGFAPLSTTSFSLLPDSSLEVPVAFQTDTLSGPVSATVTVSSNGGSDVEVDVDAKVIRADFVHDFEFGEDLDSLGYVRHNIAGGIHWAEAAGSSVSGGSKMLKVESHDYGGKTLLVLPMLTVNADGERLAFDAKVSTVSATKTSTLYVLSLSGNGYGVWSTADTLGKFSIGGTGVTSAFDTDWGTYFGDYYGITQGSSYIGLMVEDESTTFDGAATLYIDNVHYVDAPTVPIVTLGAFDQKISFLGQPFSFTNYVIGGNTGGDTLFISSITSSDPNMVVSAVSDTVVKGDDILVNFSVASGLSMGHYTAEIMFSHNDTNFTLGGMSKFMISTDFAHEAITFESGNWPDALLALDDDEDGNTWEVGMTDDMQGDYAVSSNKDPENPISENVLATFLRHVSSGDKFIFDALYTSPDPDFMHVKVSSDWGGGWTIIDDVPMSGNNQMSRYEYDLSAYVGMDVRLAIVDVNYGNSSNDRLWVDRILLPAATAMNPIANTRAMGSDSTYTHVGDTVIVTGVVTVSDQYGSLVVFQDSAAGLAAYSSAMASEVSLGDRVIAEGVLKNYRSLLELSPLLGFMVVEEGVQINPIKVSVGDIEGGTSAEALESMLVKVDGATWVDTSDWTGSGSGFNIDIALGGDTAKVRVDRDTDLYYEDVPYGSVNITGVVQQFEYNSAPYEGFQLMPRFNEDVELMAQFSGTVTDVLTGSAVSGVSVETDIDSVATDATGMYVVNASLDAERIDFSKEDYTDAFFAVDASGAGFPMLDVGLSPSPDVNLYTNGFETAADAGVVDPDVAQNTQWAVVDSAIFDSSSSSSDTVIYPFAGSYMLAVTDSGGYASNSYSWWTAPRQIDLSLYTQATVRMQAWVDTESCCDEVSVMMKSASDSTGDWTILGEINGSTNGWEEFSFSLDFLDMANTTDMELALVFDSDGSVNDNGVAVDQIWVDGRNIFVAMPPVNLMAESYGDGEVPLTWGAPGTDTAMVQMQVINPDNWIDAQAIVNDIIAGDPSQAGLTVEQWIAEIREINPRFNLHPQPETVLVPYVANIPASRGLRTYNVFRADGDGDWVLHDSTSSTSYADADVMNFETYEYTVSAVYDEGESFETAPVVARPGAVVEEHLPMMTDFNVPEGSLPGDWYNEGFLEGGNDWSVEHAGTVFDDYYFEVPDHGLFAVIDSRNDDMERSEAILVSEHFAMGEPLPAVYLKFDHFTGVSSSPIRKVHIRHAYGPWTTVGEAPMSEDGWTEAFFDITEHMMMGNGLFQIGFEYNENSNFSNYGGWAIDNVKLGVEPGPDNLIALPGPGEIHLHWGMDLGPGQDPGGSPSGYDENGRPVYLSAPECEDCQSTNSRVPGVHFSANFSADEPTQFVEYDAVLDTTTDLGDDEPTNWQHMFSDDNLSGSFDGDDQGWLMFHWSPSQQNFEQWVISDVFDAEGDSMYFMFDEYLDDYAGDGDTVAAHVSSDGGNSWTTVWEMADSSWLAPSGPEGYWNRHLYDLGAGTAQMKVAFSVRGQNSYNLDYFHVDNVMVIDEMPEDHYDEFNVFRDGELIAENIEETMFVDHGVVFGDVYCYQIQPVHVSFPDGDVEVGGYSNRACSSPCNVPPPPAVLSTPADSSLIVLVQDQNGTIVDTEGNTSLEFSWLQPEDHDGHELANAFMLQDQLQSLSQMLEVSQGVTGVSVSYEELVAAMTNAGQEEISGSWGIWTADSIDNSCCWAQSMSTMNQLTVNISQALKVDNEFIPDVFALHQNYPNPFNPVTNIIYDIPDASDVRITIYNIAGQKVRTLVQDQHDPGRYRIIWNATNDYGQPVASGMYFYRIMAKDFVSVKKLILMK